MDELAIRTALADCRFGDVRVVTEIDSTNRALLAWATTHVDEAGRPIHDGSVLIARSQTAGRGRLGRQWIAPANTALLMSALVDTSDLALGRWPLLSFAMGLAVVDAVRDLEWFPKQRDVALKWPNDVIVHDSESAVGYRKLAGILAESSLPGPGTGWVVVGVGVNLVRPQIADPNLGPDAIPTWLSDHVPKLRGDDFTVATLSHFESYVHILSQSAGAFLECYRVHCATLGRQVAADLGDRTLIGIATDVDPGGRLILTDFTNHSHIVSAGDVVHLRPHEETPDEK